MKRPFAVFDIDGTLIRWQLFHAIVDELGSRGHVPGEAYAKVRASRQQWKQRTHGESFSEYEHELVYAYLAALKDLPVDIFLTVATQVFNEYKDQVYAYTRDLIRDLKAKDYLLFAISGSQVEVVELLANYYGFDDFAGSIYMQHNGRFTGKRQVLRTENKVLALEKLIKKHGAVTSDSIGIGDSEGDIAVLHHVTAAIAFNPTQKLFQEARQYHWDVVVERKNMAYKLHFKNDHYELT